MRCYATETMTCAGRYFGNALKMDGKIFHYAAYRDGLTDDLYINVGWADETETADITQYAEVYLDSGALELEYLDGWDTPVCRISWETDPDRVFVRRKSAWVTMTNGTLETDSVRVYQSRFETLPVFSMEAPTLYAGYSHHLTWELTAGEDRNGWVTGMELRHRTPGEEAFTVQTLCSDAQLSYYTVVTDGAVLGQEVCLAVEYRTYAADWDGDDTEDFITLNRYVTPVQLVNRDGSLPLAPEALETTLLIDGGKAAVSWTAVEDPLYGTPVYVLERCGTDAEENTTGFVQLYIGESTRFRDSLPAGLTAVQYRVRVENTDGSISPWTETGTLEVAQSNIYVGLNGKWIRAAAVQAGSRTASPLAVIGR